MYAGTLHHPHTVCSHTKVSITPIYYFSMSLSLLTSIGSTFFNCYQIYKIMSILFHPYHNNYNWIFLITTMPYIGSTISLMLDLLVTDERTSRFLFNHFFLSCVCCLLHETGFMRKSLSLSAVLVCATKFNMNCYSQLES